MKYDPTIDELDEYWEEIMSDEASTAISNWHNTNASDKCENSDLEKHAAEIAESYFTEIERVCEKI